MLDRTRYVETKLTMVDIANDVDRHCKHLGVVLGQLEEADIVEFEAVVADKGTPAFTEHLRMHLHLPCRAIPVPHERHGVLPVWKVLAGVLLAEVLFHSCIHTYIIHTIC